MKKVVRILSIVLLGVMLTGVGSRLISCKTQYSDPWDYKQKEQGFYYYINEFNANETPYAVILGIDDEEAEIDNLIIPEELGGFAVREIGFSRNRLSNAPLFYGIHAERVKKITINHSLTLYACGVLGFAGELIINADVVFDSNGMGIGFYQEEERPLCNSEAIINNANPGLHSTNEINDEIRALTKDSHRCIIFDAKEGAQKTYSIIIKKEQLLIEPEIPIKSGYVFAGWFQDENYTKEWDFENDIVTENMTLYSKWLNR